MPYYGPTPVLSNFNIVTAVLGGFVSLFGLVSYLLKERYFMSEALIAMVVGVIFSHAANLFRPLEYANGSQADLNSITLIFSRLVLGVQLVLAGIQLPSRYLKTEWKPLSLLLGPVMTTTWVLASLLVWAMVPDISFLHSLAIGACVTPTDPILSNNIVKGKFADKNVPKDLQKIIIAESGANDGLGYPYLYLALYLIKYLGPGQDGNAGDAIGLWFLETWIYTIALSVIYGALVGWVAKELLHWAEERKYVDRESFLVFAISLALFVIGTCGLIGTDDVLACFIAGNAFTWDDWFRKETMDDSLQPTVDMLLNLSIFLWYGSVAPWGMFGNNPYISTVRLVFLGVLIFLLKRLPVVYAWHKAIPQIEEKRQALFVGFFGPVGVSAVFYIYISMEFLDQVTVDGVIREDAERLSGTLYVVVWFLVICSIVLHGISVPLGKVGFYLPRTISQMSTDDDTAPFSSAQSRAHSAVSNLRRRFTPGNSGTNTPQRTPNLERQVYPIGGTVIRPGSGSPANGPGTELSTGRATQDGPTRTIRFPDEQSVSTSTTNVVK